MSPQPLVNSEVTLMNENYNIVFKKKFPLDADTQTRRKQINLKNEVALFIYLLMGKIIQKELTKCICSALEVNSAIFPVFPIFILPFLYKHIKKAAIFHVKFLF